MTEKKFYEVDVFCNNCKQSYYKCQLPYGQIIGVSECPNCGCTELKYLNSKVI